MSSWRLHGLVIVILYQVCCISAEDECIRISLTGAGAAFAGDWEMFQESPVIWTRGDYYLYQKLPVSNYWLVTSDVTAAKAGTWDYMSNADVGSVWNCNSNAWLISDITRDCNSFVVGSVFGSNVRDNSFFAQETSACSGGDVSLPTPPPTPSPIAYPLSGNPDCFRLIGVGSRFDGVYRKTGQIELGYNVWRRADNAYDLFRADSDNFKQWVMSQAGTWGGDKKTGQYRQRCSYWTGEAYTCTKWQLVFDGWNWCMGWDCDSVPENLGCGLDDDAAFSLGDGQDVCEDSICINGYEFAAIDARSSATACTYSHDMVNDDGREENYFLWYDGDNAVWTISIYATLSHLMLHICDTLDVLDCTTDEWKTNSMLSFQETTWENHTVTLSDTLWIEDVVSAGGGLALELCEKTETEASVDAVKKEESAAAIAIVVVLSVVLVVIGIGIILCLRNRKASKQKASFGETVPDGDREESVEEEIEVEARITS